MPDPGDIDRIRKKLRPRIQNNRAVGFMIDEIPPATDRLSQCDRRRGEIGKAEKRNFFLSRIDETRENAGENAAVNRHAAFPDCENLPPWTGGVRVQ